MLTTTQYNIYLLAPSGAFAPYQLGDKTEMEQYYKEHYQYFIVRNAIIE